MLAQRTAVVDGGSSSGRVVDPGEAPAVSVELVALCDGLAAGEVSPAEAAFRLDVLLAAMSGSLSEWCENPDDPHCACRVCLLMQGTEPVYVVRNPASVGESFTVPGEPAGVVYQQAGRTDTGKPWYHRVAVAA